MDVPSYFHRQFAYNDWANRETLTAIRASGDKNPRVRTLLAHVLSAEGLWLERLQGEPQTLPVWPEFDLTQCEKQIDNLSRLWTTYLNSISAADLTATVSYSNSKGEPWTNRVQDVWTHVLLHSAYHRGQIAGTMRTDGHTPAYTDFIHAVRQGFIE